MFLSFVLEKDWTIFLDYRTGLLRLFLFYVLRHLPILEEKGIEYEFSFEITSKHQFPLNLFILNMFHSTSIL